MTVTVDCPFCHRPLRELDWDGHHARIVGIIEAENGGPGGTLRSSPGMSGPTARVTSTDPEQVAGTSSSVGRKTIRCVSRYHRRPVTRTVSQVALDDTWRRTVGAGLDRVSLFDITTDAVQH